MVLEKIFPAGIATGASFCNRTAEREQLMECLKNNEHIVLISPRRYGKTSLISQVIFDTAIPAVSIDFLLAPDAEYIKEAILKGVAELCSILLSKVASLKERIFAVLADFNPKLTLSAMGQKLELSSRSISPSTITEALLALETAAKEAKAHIVFVMDEFQQIATLHDNHTIEASIRHAVERSRYVTYFFSGSNRHLLEQMFNDKTRPLYHLCDLIKLERISGCELGKFIGASATKRWSGGLTNEAIEAIIYLTRCHTFYINSLCRLLWKKKSVPTAAEVKAFWHDYVYKQQWIVNDLAGLTPNQRKIVAALAQKPVAEIYGPYIRKETGLVPSSIGKTVKSLEKMDMIYKDADGKYKVLDPATLYFLVTKSYISNNS